MALFAISDLHLSLGTDKPMDVFGGKWEGYENKLVESWNNIVSENDVVLLPGDISWATYVKDMGLDFSFIERLNGKKIISKGNHDYWWSTLNKLEEFLKEQDIKTVRFLHNNCYVYNDTVICGTKGFDFEFEEKLINRELARLQLSLSFGKKSGKSDVVVMLHYPPFKGEYVDEQIMDVLKKHHVSTVVYGHIHGDSQRFYKDKIQDGIGFRLVACDYREFVPLKIRD